MSKSITPEEFITTKILFVRGQKVILDRDLAQLYGVETRDLNKAVTRNLERFPKDFMFQLKKQEFKNLMFHFGTSKQGGTRKLPRVFTEQGVAMLSSVLRSKKAIEVNIIIMRVFVRLRKVVSENKELLQKINQLEKKFGRHDKEIQVMFNLIKRLMTEPDAGKKKIGFHA